MEANGLWTATWAGGRVARHSLEALLLDMRSWDKLLCGPATPFTVRFEPKPTPKPKDVRRKIRFYTVNDISGGRTVGFVSNIDSGGEPPGSGGQVVEIGPGDFILALSPKNFDYLNKLIGRQDIHDGGHGLSDIFYNEEQRRMQEAK